MNPHSLWIGNDLEEILPALNVSRKGKVLREVAVPAVSIAVDPASRLAFVNDGYYSVQARNVVSFAPAGAAFGPVYPGDMTFADGRLWVANPIDRSLDAIDPRSGAVVREIQLPFRPRGVAFDGAGFWLTSMDDDDHVVRVTGSVAPCPGRETEGCEHGQVDVDLDLEFPAYGLACDREDGTLWVGSKGTVVHITTGGGRLDAFDVKDGRYVTALELQGKRRDER